MNEIASEQREFLERALTAERRAETLAQQLHDSWMEQEAMLVALEHQKVDQTQKQQFLEQELVRQRQRHATMQESVDNITRDRDDVRKEVQTLSTQFAVGFEPNWGFDSAVGKTAPDPKWFNLR